MADIKTTELPAAHEPLFGTETIVGNQQGQTVLIPADNFIERSEADQRYLMVENDLNDLNDASEARDNLGLGTSATVDASVTPAAGKIPLGGSAGTIQTVWVQDLSYKLDQYLAQLTALRSPSATPSLYQEWGHGASMLHPAFTFSRATTSTYIENGVLKTAAANVPVFENGGLRMQYQATNIVYPSQPAAIDSQNPPASITVVDSPNFSGKMFSISTASAVNFAKPYSSGIPLGSGKTYVLSMLSTVDKNDVQMQVSSTSGFIAVTKASVGGVFRYYVVYTTSAAETSDVQIKFPTGGTGLFGCFQIEEVPYWLATRPTSYITTTSGAGTRARDYLYIVNEVFTSVFGDASAGSVIIKFGRCEPAASGAAGSPTYATVFLDSGSDVRDANRIQLGGYSTTPPYASTWAGTIKKSDGTILTSAVPGNFLTQPSAYGNKIAFSWDSTSFSLVSNGSVKYSTIIAAGIDAVSQLLTRFAILGVINSELRSIEIYRKRLTDEQLETLTS